MRHANEPLSQSTILVVDDELMMRELLTTRLGVAGFHPLQARNGQEALVMIGQSRPAAMVLDINMPGLDGFGVLESMRRNGQIGHVKVMVLTARNQTADVRRAIALGARDFLTKPFSDNIFLARIERLLRSRPAPGGPAASSPLAAAPPAAPEADASLLL